LADKASMPLDEAVKQMGIMAERVAMLHYHYVDTLIRELGEERGRALAEEAIQAYGREVGLRHRQRVTATGASPDCDNYGTLPDLPTAAWSRENMPVVTSDGRERRVCPLAKYWIDRGAESVGRIYCHVDQAKYAAFDPECECRHLKNVLDGDDVCEVVAKKRDAWTRDDGVEE
jgi:hypothetical protein